MGRYTRCVWRDKVIEDIRVGLGLRVSPAIGIGPQALGDRNPLAGRTPLRDRERRPMWSHSLASH
jgi:hypothetical protein